MANRDKAPAAPLVLVANDQEWSARSLESILGPSGYSVVRAYTGQQALERARTAQPDIIILDAQMPDMHGFEVCRTLRERSPVQRVTPIVITTSGPSGRTQRLEAYRAGAWEFLGQPLDGEALLLKLGTFLQSKHQVDMLREENLLDSGTGLYNMRGLARRAREIGIGRHPAPRRARLRRVRARDRRTTPTRSRPTTSCSGCRTRSGLVFRQVGPGVGCDRTPGPHRVRRDRAGHRPRRRAAAGQPARRGGRGHPDPGPGRRAVGPGPGRVLRRARLRRVPGRRRGAAASRHDGASGSHAGRETGSGSGPSSRCRCSTPAEAANTVSVDLAPRYVAQAAPDCGPGAATA